MAKRRKNKAQRDLRQLESDREWLIKTNLIGIGYVRALLDGATHEGVRSAAKIHLAEMERAIEGCRPASEDALARLGAEVARLRAGVGAAIEQMAGERWVCTHCGNKDLGIFNMDPESLMAQFIALVDKKGGA
jgi:hypothetical protein